jgi:UDP-N-acetylglucosamine 2-epimerase (non-hydrolysing)
MHILHVVGARPNFMKAAPVMAALNSCKGVRQTLVHTGQHYDFSMSDVFFQQLGMPSPDVNLAVGSGTHAQQTAAIMCHLEVVMFDRKPDLVVVYGDVNSTVAAALVCTKLLISVAHVEAGLRSFDRTMPEEINRLLTDRVADLLLTPSTDGNENLQGEGVPAERIHFVGNVMIDTLIRLLPVADHHCPDRLHERYALITLHRPANVDDPMLLNQIIDSILDSSQDLAVIFPVHPRTRKQLKRTGYGPRLRFLDPIPYLEFIALQRDATVVITDSGGVQEETTYLGVPCLTVRENTERPVTVTLGTNTLVGRNPERLRIELELIIGGRGKRGQVPPLWDGHASRRIAEVLLAAGRPAKYELPTTAS